MDEIINNDTVSYDAEYTAEAEEEFIELPIESYLVVDSVNNLNRFENPDIMTVDEMVDLLFPPRITDNDNIVNGEDSKHLDDASREDSECSPADNLGFSESKWKFKKILQRIKRHVKCVTVICECIHVDPTFRDSYYNYFASQHFNMQRFSQRFSFFKGDWRDYERFSTTKDEKLQEDFIGTCVIYPTEAKTIGRTLIKPQYLLWNDSIYYLRLTDYDITVFGKRISFRAFLFQMQDKETTRCAEVTLLNILDYYGRTYSEYRTFLPSDIIRAEQDFTPDRALPSRGINYYTMSKILTRFGFTPRLYSWAAMHKEDELQNSELSAATVKNEAEMIKINTNPNNENLINNKDGWKDRELHRILHYYVESGMPVAVNVIDRKDRSVLGHSFVCIGYNGYQISWNKDAAANNSVSLHNGLKLLNAADFHTEYIVMDDNQMPYEVRSFDNLSIYSKLKIGHLLVPMCKRMNMEASDAYDVAVAMLQHETYGLVCRGGDYQAEDCVVLRMFLASSRTFKNFRINHSDGQSSEYRVRYGTTPLPRFVWVVELFSKSEYESTDGMAFGEIVLDATATTKNDVKGVIMLNYPNAVSIRNPDQSIDSLNLTSSFVLKPFPRFRGNLETIN